MLPLRREFEMGGASYWDYEFLIKTHPPAAATRCDTLVRRRTAPLYYCCRRDRWLLPAINKLLKACLLVLHHKESRDCEGNGRRGSDGRRESLAGLQ